MGNIRAIAFAGQTPEALPFWKNELGTAFIVLKATMLLTEIINTASSGCETLYCDVGCGSDIIFEEQVLLVKATQYTRI